MTAPIDTPKTAPTKEPVKYHTDADVLRFEKMAGETKQYRRKSDPKSKHIYKVINLCPHWLGIIPDREFRVQFYVAKFVVVGEGKEAKEFPVTDVADQEKAFYIDAEAFDREFDLV